MACGTKRSCDSVRNNKGIVRTPLELPFKETGFSRIHSFPRHRCDLSAEGFVIETGERPYDYDARRRGDGCLFQYTLGGEGRFQLLPNGKPVVMRRGMAFLIPFPSPTRYWLPKGAEWEFCYITLDGDMTYDLVRQLIRQYGHVWELPPTHAAIEVMRGLHRRVLDNRIPNEFESSSIAHRVLMELFNFKSHLMGPRSAPVERVIRFLERDYRDLDLDVKRIAAEAGCSRYHFSRMFRREMGTSPYAFLQRMRLQRALDLIVNTDQPLKQVAFDCGYRNYVYFCSEFKRVTRRTPGMVRRIGDRLNLSEIHTR